MSPNGLAGLWHDCFNAADVDAVVRVEVTARERFAHMIDALLGLHVMMREREGGPNLAERVLARAQRTAIGLFRVNAGRAREHRPRQL
jgi:hypothetical protein